jgi:hypothetical protein
MPDVSEVSRQGWRKTAIISYGDIANHYTHFHSHGFWATGSKFCKNSVNIFKYLKIDGRKIFLSDASVQAFWKALSMIL